MRSVITAKLPCLADGTFPSDDAVTALLTEFGWRPIPRPGVSADVATAAAPQTDDKAEAPPIPMSREDALLLFREMPEVAAAERLHVIDWGWIGEAQVAYVVTRTLGSLLTFRLLHKELPRLRSATLLLLRRLESSAVDTQPMPAGASPKSGRRRFMRLLNWMRLTIALPWFGFAPLEVGLNVPIYERNADHVIIRGRVVQSPLFESLRNSVKDILLVAFPICISIALVGEYVFIVSRRAPVGTSASAGLSPFFAMEQGTIEKMITALATTALISALNIFATYWTIRREHPVIWDVDTAGST